MHHFHYYLDQFDVTFCKKIEKWQRQRDRNVSDPAQLRDEQPCHCSRPDERHEQGPQSPVAQDQP